MTHNRSKNSLVWLWGAAALVSASPAWAGRIASADVHPNIQTAEVRIQVADDPDGNADVTVSYRRTGGQTWLSAPPPVRLDGGQLTAALFWLQADTDYEVRVSLRDGSDTDEQTASFRTRDVPAPPTGLGEVYVDAENGRSGASGTSSDPFSTIQEAVDAAAPGTIIYVASGTYREQVHIQIQASADEPLWIVGQDTGDGLPLLLGSDGDIESGQVSWSSEGGGVFSTTLTEECRYLVADDHRLYDYHSLEDLREENGDIGQPGVIAGGFFWDQDQGKLYVLLPDHSDPSDHVIHASVRRRAFFVEGASGVFIQGLRIRYYSRAVDLKNCVDCGVVHVQAHLVNDGVRIRGDDARRNVAANLDLYDDGPSYWPWDSCKHHTCEAGGIAISGGRDHVAVANAIQGFFNGIYTGQWDTTDWSIARNTDVIGNVIVDIGDDGLEPEGACVQHKFVANRIERVHNAISLAPIETGPTWVVRNVVLSYRAHALKINVAPTGYTFIYHTTALPDPDRPGAQPMSPSEPFGNFTFRNNIWVSNRYVIEYIPEDLAGPVSMDYDLLWTYNADGGNRFVKWRNVRYHSLDEWSQATGLEEHGLFAEPVFEDPASGDYTLAEGSPGLDSGEVLSGINDQDASGLPDMGAIERGGGAPVPPAGDAGPVGPPDGGAGPSADGATPHPGADGGSQGGGSSGGCDCRTGGAPLDLWFLVALLLGGATFLCRRRRW